jgi:SRSO17 transposase
MGGLEKTGAHTAGIKRQYLGCGPGGQRINVVYAGYAAPARHAVIAARLYVGAGSHAENCRVSLA